MCVALLAILLGLLLFFFGPQIIKIAASLSLSLSLSVLSVFLSDLGAGFTRLLVGVYLPATSAAAAAGLAGDHVPVGH